jgi:hypothetical protein
MTKINVAIGYGSKTTEFDVPESEVVVRGMELERVLLNRYPRSRRTWSPVVDPKNWTTGEGTTFTQKALWSRVGCS